ncbi:hypothetical protein ACVI1J_010483 [Bradyrhizobium diazoefficiens]
MLKEGRNLLSPDPYYAGSAGFVGSTLEALHGDMSVLALPDYVPESVRRSHDGIRNAYIYSYFAYDLLTLAAAQTFPCLELALRLRIGHQFAGRTTRKGKPMPPAMLGELLGAANAQGLVAADVRSITMIRNMFAHGSDTVLNAPIFLEPFRYVTAMIAELFDPAKNSHVP